MNTTQLRHQTKEFIDQLSPKRLQVAADFLAYLAERESNEATEELLNIPGFLESFERSKKDIAEEKVTNWREIRNDV